MSGTIFEQVLGEDFAKLPAALRHFHGARGKLVLQGHVRILGPSTWRAWLLAKLLGAPLRTEKGPITFELQVEDDKQTWTRHFPSKNMSSTFERRGSVLVEKLGPAEIELCACVVGSELRMGLRSMKCFGVSCPQWLLPEVVAKETGDLEQFYFEVKASHPLLGRVVCYQGHLAAGPVAGTDEVSPATKS